MNNKILIAVIGIILVALAIFLLMRNMNRDTMSPTENTQEQTAPQRNLTGFIEGDVTVEEDGAKEFTINGTSFSYDVQQLNVKKGDRVTITFSSVNGTHDFNIDELNVHSEVVDTGETTTVEFVADEVGTFEYYCSVMNHREQGMVGSLIVTE